MSMYEGMYIFPKALSDEALEEVLNTAREEIEKLGGSVKSTTRLGRRTFARPINKQDSGHYAVLDFEIDGSKVKQLKARYKLNENIIRVQVVNAVEVKSEA